MAQTQNPFLLAADNSPALLPLLREKPHLASAQDEHGYSLIHAAASYNHLDLLRTLVREFHVDVDLEDEDGETALFVVETPEAAKMLVTELSANFRHRSSEGLTPRDKIEAEADFPAVAAFLAAVESGKMDDTVVESAAPAALAALPNVLQPLPEGMKLTVGALDEANDIPGQADPEFRRRIEELAHRDDFNTPSGQADLRKLVEDAIGLGHERNVRSKHA